MFSNEGIIRSKDYNPIKHKLRLALRRVHFHAELSRVEIAPPGAMPRAPVPEHNVKTLPRGASVEGNPQNNDPCKLPFHEAKQRIQLQVDTGVEQSYWDCVCLSSQSTANPSKSDTPLQVVSDEKGIEMLKNTAGKSSGYTVDRSSGSAAARIHNRKRRVWIVLALCFMCAAVFSLWPFLVIFFPSIEHDSDSNDSSESPVQDCEVNVAFTTQDIQVSRGAFYLLSPSFCPCPF